MALTTLQILALARNKILEKTNDVVSDETMLIYANLAYQDVIRKISPKRSIQKANVVFTNGVGALPADFGTIYTDAMDSQGNYYPEMSIADFIRADGQNAICIENNQFKATNNLNATLTVYFWPSYQALTTAVNPSINDAFHEVLVYGIVYRAFEDLQDPELATYYKNEFQTKIKENSDDLSSYDEDGQRGNVMFNPINIVPGGYRANNPNKW